MSRRTYKYIDFYFAFTLHLIHMKLIKDMRAHGHTDAQTYGRTDIPINVHEDIQAYEHTDMRRHGHTESRMYGHTEVYTLLLHVYF